MGPGVARAGGARPAGDTAHALPLPARRAQFASPHCSPGDARTAACSRAARGQGSGLGVRPPKPLQIPTTVTRYSPKLLCRPSLALEELELCAPGVQLGCRAGQFVVQAGQEFLRSVACANTGVYPI